MKYGEQCTTIDVQQDEVVNPVVLQNDITTLKQNIDEMRYICMYACTGDNKNSWVCVITRGIKIIFIHVPTMIISFIYTCITELHKCILYITLNIVHFKPTCTCSFAYQQSLNLSDTCTCKRQRLSWPVSIRRSVGGEGLLCHPLCMAPKYILPQSVIEDIFTKCSVYRGVLSEVHLLKSGR